MNYDTLAKLISARRLPNTGREPRAKLHKILRDLETLRDLRRSARDADLPTIDKQIALYERMLGEDEQHERDV